MADSKKKNNFFNSTKQTTNSSSSTDITSQVKQAIDMSVLSLLTGMARDLSALTKHITGSKTKDEKETEVVKKESKKEEDPKDSSVKTKKQLKEQKREQKKLEKSQKKSNKKVDKEEKREQKKEDLQKTLKNIRNSLSGFVGGALKDMTKTSGKIITGSSTFVDKELRDLQVGMGLDTNQAMALQGSMQHMKIDKGDLAFLTKGQRDMLSTLTGTMERAYAGTNMDAIGEMGNSMFMISGLLSTLKDIIFIKLQEVMTVLQPAFDAFEILLGQVINTVLAIFESPAFKNLLNLVTQVIGSLVNILMPMLEGALGQIGDIIINLLIMLLPLVEQLAPILMLFVNIILSLLVPLMPMIAQAIQFIMQLIEILVPIILQFLPVVVMVLQFIGLLLELIMPILMPIIQLIGKVMERTIPLIYKIIASVYNAIISLYNFFVKKKDEKPYMSTSITVDSSPSFSMPKMDISVANPNDIISNSYAGGNNVDSITNNTKNITVDASFSSNITGDASQYSQELQKTNYSSSTLLASIIEEGA